MNHLVLLQIRSLCKCLKEWTECELRDCPGAIRTLSSRLTLSQFLHLKGFSPATKRAKRRNEKSFCKFKPSALTSMQHLMLHHVGMLRKCLLAAGTLVRLQTCLGGKAAALREGLRDSSVIRLTVVHQVVALQIRQLRERLVANRAEVGDDS